MANHIKSQGVVTKGPIGIQLTNVTSNLILYNGNGSGAPSNTTRSTGTKIVLYPSLTSSTTDYAIGVHNIGQNTAELWNSVYASTGKFTWYGGSTLIATLTGTGLLSTADSIYAGNPVVEDNARVYSDNGGSKWCYMAQAQSQAGTYYYNIFRRKGVGTAAYWTGDGSDNISYITIGASIFYTAGGDRGRFDTSGNFLVGASTVPNIGAGTGSGFGVTPSGNIITNVAPGVEALATNYPGYTTGNVYPVVFRTNGGTKGYISVNGTTVSYNTGSDYRLKNIDGPVTDSGTFIDALKPVQGTWKADGSKFVGFVAHEFAEVSPNSVSGEKDAVDEAGNPIYQAMQAGSAEVIANLVAELQELRKRVAILENK